MAALRAERHGSGALHDVCAREVAERGFHGRP
jgi:hypothetical protein